MNPELDEKLSALLDGELSPEEAEALRAELALSPELTARLAALAAVDDGLRALPSPRVPSALRGRVARQVREDVPARRRAPRSGATRGLLTAAAFAAAAAAALALVVLPRLGREEAQVARSEPEPAAPVQIAEQAPAAKPAHEAPAPPAPVREGSKKPPVALAEQLPVPGLAPAPADEEPAAEDVALADDLPVIEVLDVLAELDELERVGSG